MKTKEIKKEPILNIPLSSLKFLSNNQELNTITIEVNINEIKRINEAETLDDIINEGRFDYAIGNYKSFTNAKDLISELRS